MDKISLEAMEFYAHHGCFSEEQKIGTYFLIDVVLTTDISKAAKSDNLADAIDYQKVYQFVQLEMQQTSHLLENVAERIATTLFNHFASVQEISIKVAKKNPPLGGKVQQSSVYITRKHI
ncbi:MAG: dihydroneopterin aldolase [Bacteroidales bacterium]